MLSFVKQGESKGMNIKIRERNISEQAIIDDLKRVSEILGKSSITSSEYALNGKYGISTVLRKFSKWNDALLKSGLDVQNQTNISNEDLFKNLESVWNILGRQPTTKDFKTKDLSKYSLTVYESRFDGWCNTLVQFQKYNLNKQEN